MHGPPTESNTSFPRKRIFIHPGSGGQAKCWPPDRFAALAQALQPAAVHWLLGPAELESTPGRFAAIRDRCRTRNEPLLIEEDLLRAAEHIAGMDLYIGNDAGMTHVAAALGIPTVAIYGPTDPAVWRPLGDHVRVISPPARAPIATVPIETVLSAARQFLMGLDGFGSLHTWHFGRTAPVT